MGIFDFFRGIKPSKDKIALLKKQLEEGRVLSVDTGKDNKQIMNEADYVTQ